MNLHPKQIRFAQENQLIIGSATGNGKYLGVGEANSFLKFNGETLEWSVAETDRISNGDNVSIITQTDTIDFIIDDSTLKLVKTETGLGLTVEGLEGQKDLQLIPADGGAVVIGGEGDGTIEAEADEDLTISGGAGKGNLILGSGNEGDVYVGRIEEDFKVATTGDVKNAFLSNFQRVTYNGEDSFTIPTEAVSVEVYVNGSLCKRSDYEIILGVVGINEGQIGFTLDAEDTIEIIYVGAPHGN